MAVGLLYQRSISQAYGCLLCAAVGIEADSERVDALLKELEGKDITEVIASGVSKLASVPAGGGAVAASGGALDTIAFMCFSFAGSPRVAPC